MQQGPIGSRFTWLSWILIVCTLFIAITILVILLNRPVQAQELPGGATTQWRSGPESWRGAPATSPKTPPCFASCPYSRPQPFIFIQPGAPSPQVGLIGPHGIAATVPPLTTYPRR